MRAVHGFEQIFFAFFRGVNGLERVFAIFCVVTGGYIEVFVTDMRGDDGQVAISALNFGEHILQTVAQHSAFWQPQGQSLTHILREGEEFHLLAELAVVALFCFFEHHEIFVEHFLLGEANAIHAHQLRAFFIAAPIGTGNRQNFHCLNIFGVGDMRSFAKVGKITLCVGGDFAVFEFTNEFAFQGLSLVAKIAQCVGFRDVGSHHSLFARHNFLHFLFDFLKIGTCDGVITGVDVVVEAVFNSRANTELYALVELLQGFSEQVGRCVPKGVLTLIVVPLKEFDFTIGGDGSVDVPFFAIE